MRGDVLAFPNQDRSHTCSVRDRPTQLWSGYIQHVLPYSRHAVMPRGG
ncbi:hypothetical protein RGQ29_000213 [Quercus rubra]|uniref:Uncharacterized protein n=1 Tax=Quercus rubra TaxID=3512 RepID=A0AAN7GE35_QUERU|nr:hypothetical protein RGQ29_000213 [Quercus rubra]